MVALFLAAAFALLMLCSLGAKADTTAGSQTVTIGSPLTIPMPNENFTGTATVLSASTNNSAIVTVTYGTNDFTLVGVSAGQAQVTVRARDSRDNHEFNMFVPVTVTGSSSTGYTRNVSTPLGTTVTLDSFNYVASTNSSNTSVSTVYQSGNAVMATAASVGTSTITVIGTKAGTTNQATYTYYLTVTSTSTGTNTSNVSLRAGQDALIGQGGAYSSVSNYSSSNTSVATVTLNNNVITISGKSTGTAVVTFTATVAGTGQVVTYTVNVTVTGSYYNDGYIDNIYDGTGLDIGIAERIVAEGKSYRLKGITQNGTPVAANELLWLSTDDTIVTVGKATGIFKARKTGTARLIAVDKLGRYHLTVAITVQ